MISLTLKATPKVRNDVKTRRKKATGEGHAGELSTKEEARCNFHNPCIFYNKFPKAIQTDEIHG